MVEGLGRQASEVLLCSVETRVQILSAHGNAGQVLWPPVTPVLGRWRQATPRISWLATLAKLVRSEFNRRAYLKI